MEPPELLRGILAGARAHGLTFDAAWPGAVVRASQASTDPSEWLEILGGQRDAWENCYERTEASAGERALVALASDDGQRDRSLEGRRCDYCDRLIPVDRDPRARYCGDECARSYNYRLEQLRAAGVSVDAHDRRARHPFWRPMLDAHVRNHAADLIAGGAEEWVYRSADTWLAAGAQGACRP